MTVLFEKFIAEHELDIACSDLDSLVKNALLLMYENTKEQVTAKEPSTKLENPAKATTRDDLRNCTKEVLNAFCKENGLRVGGNKKDVIDRVWRCTQDNSDEEDISPRAKPKVKKVVVKNECCGKTAKGTPCTVSGDELINGKCYCWRHAKGVVPVKEESDDEDESEMDDIE